MDSILEESYLFDFYGELLTEHQRQIYEQVILEDLSLGEAAEAFGISRQAVYDMLRRTRKTLMQYEEKLGLIRRFVEARSLVEKVRADLDALEDPVLSEEERQSRISRASEQLTLIEEML